MIIIPIDVLDKTTIAELAVYAAIREHLDNMTGKCCPDHETIVNALTLPEENISIDVVGRAIKSLEQKRLISVNKARGDNLYFFTPAAYRLVLIPIWARRKMTQIELSIYACISRFKNSGTNDPFPSMETIKEILDKGEENISEITIIKAVDALDAKGIMAKRKVITGDNQSSTLYIFVDQDPADTLRIANLLDHRSKK